MNDRQGGFTLIEILVVITIIAALVGLVTLLIPEGQKAQEKTQCLNNLRNIGGKLGLMPRGEARKESGALFLLQIAKKLKDGDLKVFICPAESPPADRPDSKGLIDLIRKHEDALREIPEKTLHAMTSYAGANWAGHPFNAISKETRIWGCDACRNRIPHHEGITVLLEGGATCEFWDVDKIEGQEKEKIEVGPGSGDPRLAKTIFYPKQ